MKDITSESENSFYNLNAVNRYPSLIEKHHNF